MSSALISPPMPWWEDLSEGERNTITREIGDTGCCCHCSPPSGKHAYEEIRKVLKDRERRIFQATMDGPPPEHCDAEQY